MLAEKPVSCEPFEGIDRLTSNSIKDPGFWLPSNSVVHGADSRIAVHSGRCVVHLCAARTGRHDPVEPDT